MGSPTRFDRVRLGRSRHAGTLPSSNPTSHAGSWFWVLSEGAPGASLLLWLVPYPQPHNKDLDEESDVVSPHVVIHPLDLTSICSRQRNGG